MICKNIYDIAFARFLNYNFHKMKLEKLPLPFTFDSKPILKRLISAHRELAALNGRCASIPNQAILIQTLSLQEAKDSSEIENIITTNADIFTTMANPDYKEAKPAAKEVIHYASAISKGLNLYHKNDILTLSIIENIQSMIEFNNAGIKKLPGTKLVNNLTEEVVYEPPLPNELLPLLDNFLHIFNVDDAWEIDPLVKMAILHYQFESIHPFYDGNGRTGRILNVLYLIHENLLEYPVLYLSRFININKSLYYKYLQAVRDCSNEEAWEDYLLFMLEGIERTSKLTSNIVLGLIEMMNAYKHDIRSKHPSFYSQDLIYSLFFFPYTKINILKERLDVAYLTARKYLDSLVDDGLLQKIRLGRDNYYVNIGIMNLLSNIESGKLKIES